MRTRPVLTFFLVILLLMPLILVPMNSGFAQDTRERWAFGLHAGGNMWFNDYNQRVVGEGGELMARYGISRAFSVGLLTGYEELKSNQEPIVGGVKYLKLQAIPASVVGWLHLVPDNPFIPYLYLGVGTLIYKRAIGGNINVTEGKFKTSIHVPAGVGFEAFLSNDVSIAADIGYRITDDYTDGLKAGSVDVYATAKVGVNFYFGTSASEKAGLARARTRQTREATEAEVQRVKEAADAEALRMRTLADAEARRAKDSTEAEVRRLVELNAHRPAVDTVIVLFRGQTVILKGIYFESGKAAVTAGSESTLRSAFNALLASPDVKVLIVGHTDKTGSRTYNKKLSLRRAQTVRSWLIREGISGKRLTVAGKGFDEPIDDNSTPEGQANNRRIEFRVLK